MSVQKHSNFSTILSLSLVLIVDAVVMGIVFPIMGALFIQPQYAIVPAATSMALRDVLYSVAMGSFFLCAIIGAPFLGDLSDIIGRRKVLLLSLFINGISCLLSAAAIGLRWPLLLIGARALAGLSAGNQPLAQAAIIDISTPQTKARNLSLISLASSLGFIVGPLLGGVLSNNHLWHVLTYATPFQFAAVFAFLNALYLLFAFRETFHPTTVRRVKFSRGFTLLWDGFRHPKLRGWMLLFLIEQFAWGIYFQSVSLILTQVHHYSTTQVGLFLVVLSITFAISLSIIIPLCLKRFSVISLLGVGLVLAIGSMIFSVIFIQSVWAAWLTEVPFGIGQALIYTCCITLISNAVDNDNQGWAMGVATAAGSFAWGIAALSVGFLVNENLQLPFMGAALLFMGCLYFVWRKRKTR